MSYLLGQVVRFSFTNPLKASYKFSRHYSVLTSYKSNNSSDNFLNRKTNASNQLTQARNFSLHEFVDGYLSNYVKLANSKPADYFIEQLLNVHDLGIPWWGTIALSCATLRWILLFPFIVAQEKEMSEIHHAAEKMKDSHKTVEQGLFLQARKNNWTQQKLLQEIKISQKEATKKVRKESRFSFKMYRVTVGAITQIFLWTFITVCLRRLWFLASRDEDISGQVLKYELSNEGILWFKNLLKPDRFGIPILMAIGNLAVLELTALKRGIKTLWLTHILRVLMLIISVVSAIMPTNITFFWLVSTYTALGQHLLLLSPRFRKLIRLSPSTVDERHPYRVLRARFYMKWGF